MKVLEGTSDQCYLEIMLRESGDFVGGGIKEQDKLTQYSLIHLMENKEKNLPLFNPKFGNKYGNKKRK